MLESLDQEVTKKRRKIRNVNDLKKEKIALEARLQMEELPLQMLIQTRKAKAAVEAKVKVKSIKNKSAKMKARINRKIIAKVPNWETKVRKAQIILRAR